MRHARSFAAREAAPRVRRDRTNSFADGGYWFHGTCGARERRARPSGGMMSLPRRLRADPGVRPAQPSRGRCAFRSRAHVSAWVRSVSPLPHSRGGRSVAALAQTAHLAPDGRLVFRLFQPPIHNLAKPAVGADGRERPSPSDRRRLSGGTEATRLDQTGPIPASCLLLPPSHGRRTVRHFRCAHLSFRGRSPS